MTGIVEDVGDVAAVRAGVDAAYRTKYGRHGGTERMVTAAAAATTLQLSPQSAGE